ncbi:MAG TPA: hypothetical protein DEG17_24350 [Cyanobacteria bacterium UBA11149]|nr:hypothetical protein [Cyanobacteria bacterium UBA11366]HBR72258.1 hypothetical protein [Cyanobacteria bacterium UBA11159]HBS68430.1 hypothetical protein [Cyanobacteria bacterium UBA11153]HBW91910.1 hypothetical protein [Cyanobacteria bacterium UBA11149]HCA94481.1 hypothetical protein [Cyanobacteria bacterium UBA9226]
MNLITVANLNKPYLNVLLERAQAGHFIASVPELTDCVAWAETRESAIALLQEKVKVRLANIEVLRLEVSDNPWTDFIGMFEGDKDFAEIAAELRQERELEINGAV